MNSSISQFLDFIGKLPFSRKVSIAFTLMIVIAGFACMFFWANQEDYQVLFRNLSPQDGGSIVAKLKEKSIPYKVEAAGTLIMVPAEKVDEMRLEMAGEGLPSGGGVGFEIFDNPDFRTTKFVQELNYRRALQGELSRTISMFNEVKSSAVFLAIPKDSLFIDDKRPASASIQLDLTTSLPPKRIAAIVHLVANAVEGLEPDHVTVVDTRGRVLFKGEAEEEDSGILNSSKLDYKRNCENEIKDNVQSMLETIVGSGKAIVRVSADIDFSKVILNQEEYDPYSSAVRSKRDLQESIGTGADKPGAEQTSITQRTGVLPSANITRKSKTKKDTATNYEINKTVREIVKPAGKINRLSVAAVIDGTYKQQKGKGGKIDKIYLPRSEKEMKTFEEIVKKAMGYNEDREDSVSVRCIPFTDAAAADMVSRVEDSKLNPLTLILNHKKLILNFALVILIFFLIVRPLLRSLRSMAQRPPLQGAELQAGSEGYMQIPQPQGASKRDRVLEISRSDPEKTREVLKGWIGES